MRIWLSVASMLLILASGRLPADEILLDPPSKSEMQQALERVARGDLAGAKELVESAAKADPNSSHPEVMLAGLLLQIGNRAAGRSLLEQLAVQQSERFDVRFAFCVLAFQEKRWFDAITHAKQCMSAEMPETWTDSRRKLALHKLQLIAAQCSEGRGDWQRALRFYQAVAKNDSQGQPSESSDPQAIQGLGRVHFFLDDPDKSYQYFDQLHNMIPQSEIAELSLARLYEASNKAEKAADWYAKAMKESPAETQLPYAKWLIWNNRPQDARKILSAELNALRSETGGEQEQKYLQSLVERMEGNYDAAVKILSPLHRNDPSNFGIGNQLALCLIEEEQESQRARALQIAEANARNNPNSAEAWATLGWIEFRLGDLNQAQEHLGIATKAGNISRDTAYFLSKLYAQLGDSVKSLELSEAVQSATGPFFYAVQANQ